MMLIYLFIESTKILKILNIIDPNSEFRKLLLLLVFVRLSFALLYELL